MVMGIYLCIFLLVIFIDWLCVVIVSILLVLEEVDCMLMFVVVYIVCVFVVCVIELMMVGVIMLILEVRVMVVVVFWIECLGWIMV